MRSPPPLHSNALSGDPGLCDPGPCDFGPCDPVLCDAGPDGQSGAWAPGR